MALGELVISIHNLTYFFVGDHSTAVPFFYRVIVVCLVVLAFALLQLLLIGAALAMRLTSDITRLYEPAYMFEEAIAPTAHSASRTKRPTVLTPRMAMQLEREEFFRMARLQEAERRAKSAKVNIDSRRTKGKLGSVKSNSTLVKSNSARLENNKRTRTNNSVPVKGGSLVQTGSSATIKSNSKLKSGTSSEEKTNPTSKERNLAPVKRDSLVKKGRPAPKTRNSKLKHGPSSREKTNPTSKGSIRAPVKGKSNRKQL